MKSNPRDTAREKKHQAPEAEDTQSGKNAYWTSGHPSYSGVDQADQCSSPPSKAQDTRRPCCEDSGGSAEDEDPSPKLNKHIDASEKLKAIIYFEE